MPKRLFDVKKIVSKENKKPVVNPKTLLSAVKAGRHKLTTTL
jgi:hypothetical protein